jgi:lysozyme
MVRLGRLAALLLALGPVALTQSACDVAGEDDDAFDPSEFEDDTNRMCGVDPFAADGVRGIDVSKHQGAVDFARIAAATEMKTTTTTFNLGGKKRPERRIPGKVQFAVARVSFGLTVKDGQLFQDNMRAIRAAGLIPGAYQFLRPNQSAEAQAKFFIEELDKAGGYQPGDIPPTVDIEVSDGATAKQVQEGVKIWVKMVGEHYKVRPIVYSLAGISSFLGDDLTASPLWIANFYQTCPKMPAGWLKTSPPTPWTFFQFDDAGHVDGIRPGVFVDLNVFNGTQAQFVQFLADSDLSEPAPTNPGPFPPPF